MKADNRYTGFFLSQLESTKDHKLLKHGGIIVFEYFFAQFFLKVACTTFLFYKNDKFDFKREKKTFMNDFQPRYYLSKKSM